MITEGQVLDIAKDAIYYIIICSASVLICWNVGHIMKNVKNKANAIST